MALSVITTFCFLLLLLLIGRNLLQHRNTQKKFEGFYEFHSQVMDWAKECTDRNAQLEMMKFSIELLNQYKSYEEASEGYDNIPNIKQVIITSWGKHIPSLQKEIRNSKLDQILNK